MWFLGKLVAVWNHGSMDIFLASATKPAYAVSAPLLFPQLHAPAPSQVPPGCSYNCLRGHKMNPKKIPPTNKAPTPTSYISSWYSSLSWHHTCWTKGAALEQEWMARKKNCLTSLWHRDMFSEAQSDWKPVGRSRKPSKVREHAPQERHGCNKLSKQIALQIWSTQFDTFSFTVIQIL